MSTSDPEGYLGHPVNAYKLMKRLNTEWTELESLVLQNPSDGKTETGQRVAKVKVPLTGSDCLIKGRPEYFQVLLFFLPLWAADRRSRVFVTR